MSKSNNKKRLFIVNDASFISSGYGVYGKELLTRLYNTGKYDIGELGCYAEKSSPEIKDIPWKFYANAVSNTDPRIETYKKSASNQFGNWRFSRCLFDFKPHIVFDVRDYWMSSYQEISPLRPYFHWVLMPTVDSAPQKTEWLYTFSNADIVVPYTRWAKKTLASSCGHKINLFPKIANAGVDQNQFNIIEDRKSLIKNLFNTDHDLSIVGTVMRNQKRKLFDDLFIAYRRYLNVLLAENNQDLYNKSFLYIHTSFPEETGWDIPSMLYEHNLLDKTYITYVCRKCKNYFPSKFQSSVTVCKHCGNHTATFSSVVNGVNSSQLNEIYNCFDLYIQYAICEGFGMPQIEAASCGVPIASVDYSAMTEIAENLEGTKIAVLKLYRELESGAYRAIPNIDATIKCIYDYLAKSDDAFKNNKRQRTRQLCVQQYTWDHVAKVWDECFDGIDISKKTPWTQKLDKEPRHQNLSVPSNLNPKEFVEYICYNIINDPYLAHTAYAQNMIKDLTYGLISRGGSMRSFTRKDAVESLEQQLKTKLMIGDVLSGKANLKEEDYL
jgi:glycosyltransferase involved in cell wall biosynthesis